MRQVALTLCCPTCARARTACGRPPLGCLPAPALTLRARRRCHFTLGNSVADAFKSLELARTAWGIATGGEAADAADPNVPLGRGVLKPGGSLVMKLLQGPGEQRHLAELSGAC